MLKQLKGFGGFQVKTVKDFNFRTYLDSIKFTRIKPYLTDNSPPFYYIMVLI